MSDENNPKPHIKQKDFADRNLSAIEEHDRDGKILAPPFARLPAPITFSSWRDFALPNVLWACVLTGTLERDHYLDLFRRVAVSCRRKIDNFTDTGVTHNYISMLGQPDFESMFSPVLESDLARESLSCLRLLECLPDINLWTQYLEEPEQISAWETLAHSIAKCMDHQSQESTDIRWLKIIHKTIVGKIVYPDTMKERIEEFRLYPNKGDMRVVRPSIRALEMGLRNAETGAEKPDHIPDGPGEAFWDECFKKTECIHSNIDFPEVEDVKSLLDEITKIQISVDRHFFETMSRTSVDVRHEGAFGLTFYALSLLFELAHSRSHLLAGGRILLRSIMETYVTLHYLKHNDNETIWAQYRNYGAGQTKLAFLKGLRDEEVPDFIDLKDLEDLANEDMWLEFQEINLGAWANKNLRAMAVESGCKEIYDKYYSWSSGFAHAHWGAVRYTSFQICMNPLHRLHHIPTPPQPSNSALIDGCKLCNLVLDDLGALYPSMRDRIGWHKLHRGAEL